jgi:hypothetical protein
MGHNLLKLIEKLGWAKVITKRGTQAGKNSLLANPVENSDVEIGTKEFC